VSGHEQGGPEFPAAAGKEGQDLVSGLGVQVSRRFVRQDDSRFLHQGPGDGHPLLLAAGQLGGKTGFLPVQAYGPEAW